MAYQYIAYVSASTKPLCAAEIDALLLDARNFNLEAGVTGVLLCQKNTFFQFFEGSPESVAKVYDRIKNAKQHTCIIELANEYSKKPYFTSWTMGFCYLPKSEMQALIHAEWQNQIPSVTKYAKESLGLKMLQEFWFRLATKEAA